MPKPLLGTGGYDFTNAANATTASRVLWTAWALPTVTAIAELPKSLGTPDVQLSPDALSWVDGAAGPEFIIERGGAILRVQIVSTSPDQPAVLLPLDRLFDIRAAAALRLWRGLTGRKPGPAPGILTAQMIDGLILGLRAVDGRQAGAGHYEIAQVLLRAAGISKRDWINHDIRDKTGRLVRKAFALVDGGYRRLLLYPYRRKIQDLLES
jgi:hypothetical protein